MRSYLFCSRELRNHRTWELNLQNQSCKFPSILMFSYICHSIQPKTYFGCDTKKEQKLTNTVNQNTLWNWSQIVNMWSLWSESTTATHTNPLSRRDYELVVAAVEPSALTGRWTVMQITTHYNSGMQKSISEHTMCYATYK